MPCWDSCCWTAALSWLMPSWPAFWPWWRAQRSFCSSWHLEYSMVFLLTCFDWHLESFMILYFLAKNIWNEKCSVSETYMVFLFPVISKVIFPSHLPFVIVTSALLWKWPLPPRDFRESTSCFISWRRIKYDTNVPTKISCFCYLLVINPFARYY